MIFALHCLACIGLYMVFKLFGESFAWGWLGGITCAIMLRALEQVPA
jgi:hypothetical protein